MAVGVSGEVMAVFSEEKGAQGAAIYQVDEWLK